MRRALLAFSLIYTSFDTDVRQKATVLIEIEDRYDGLFLFYLFPHSELSHFLRPRRNA